MALIEWDDKFLTGIEEIDEHAKQFVSLLNLINEESGRGVSDACRGALLSTLSSLSQFHFQYEERLMQKVKYLGFPAHKEDHDAFLSRLMSSRDLCRDDLVEFLEFLGGWALRHLSQLHPELNSFGVNCFGRKGGEGLR